VKDKPFRPERPEKPAPKNLWKQVVREEAEPAAATDTDIYASPSKRLEAIKQRGLGNDRKGTKTTFLKKRSKKDRDSGSLEQDAKAADVVSAKNHLFFSGPMTVKEVSHETGVKSSDIIMFLMKELQLMSTLNQSLDYDIISLVCEHFGITITKTAKVDADDELEQVIAAKSEGSGEQVTRPPVVTVLGHVDHGKTKLLDAVRHTDVVAGEAGGITQHIGAYQIVHNSRPITFLDTPGHAAFTQLRARGAKVTDLAVLVVAADDGVMPQTVEAIDHAKEAKVPILVAVNKIDKPQANPDRVKQQLSDKGLIPEEWGGQTVYVNISAKMKTNIEELLDMVFLVTDIMDLKYDPKRKAIGTVIEAKIDKGKGPVATVLVQNGTLYSGDFVVAGTTYGKIRAMENDKGERVPAAGAATPVELTGLHDVPEAGDQLFAIEDEKTAREISSKRLLKSREEKLRYEARVTLEDLFKKIQQEQLKELKVVLKGDVQGSIEAITSALEGIKHEEVRVKVIRADVGEIKETDVMLAAASSAIILGYNIGINAVAQAQANTEKIEVRHYNVIYNLIDDVKRAMAGMLAIEYEEVYAGKAEVRKVFASSRVGNIAGSIVQDGELQTGQVAKVFRGGKEILKTKVSSLKRFKDNVKTVAQGYECGILLDKFDTYEEGDVIETFKLVEKKQETI